MSDWFASENLLYTKSEIAWFCRKRSIWEKIIEFFFGKETVDHHFYRY